MFEVKSTETALEAGHLVFIETYHKGKPNSFSDVIFDKLTFTERQTGREMFSTEYEVQKTTSSKSLVLFFSFGGSLGGVCWLFFCLGGSGGGGGLLGNS